MAMHTQRIVSAIVATGTLVLCVGCPLQRHHPYDQERCPPCPSGFSCYEGQCMAGQGADTLAGAAQKGPFASGAKIEALALDARGVPTGKVFTSETDNGLGEYEVRVDEGYTYQVSARGAFFNELLGGQTETVVELAALVQPSASGTTEANVNALTHLAYRRAAQLLGEGGGAESAIAVAEEELRAVLGLVYPGSTRAAAATMNLIRADVADSQYLLAASCLLLQAAQREGGPLKLQPLLDHLGQDLADDGKLEAAFADKLREAHRTLDPASCKTNLQLWLQHNAPGKVVPDLDRAIDTDGDGIANAVDDDDDGDGTPDDADCAPLDPAVQVVLEQITSSMIGGQMYGLDLVGDFAVVSGMGLLEILDISQPAQPASQVSTLKIEPPATYCNAVHVAFDHAHLLCKGYLWIVDISVPQTPRTTSSSLFFPGAVALAATQDRLVVVSPEEVSFVDLADRAAPTVITTAAPGGLDVKVDELGKFALVAGPQGAREYYAHSGASSSEFSATGNMRAIGGDLFNRVFIATPGPAGGELHVITRQPGPQRQGAAVLGPEVSFPDPSESGGIIAAQDSWAFVAGKDALFVVDGSKAGEPKVAGSYAVPGITAVRALSRDLLFATTKNGLWVLSAKCI